MVATWDAGLREENEAGGGEVGSSSATTAAATGLGHGPHKWAAETPGGYPGRACVIVRVEADCWSGIKVLLNRRCPMVTM